MADSTKGGAGSSGGGALSSGKRKPSAPTNDREIADVTGVTSVGEKVRAAQSERNVRRFKNSATGEETVEGETVEQLRARVKKEREESEPSEFQKSVLGGLGPIEREPVRAGE